MFKKLLSVGSIVGLIVTGLVAQPAAAAPQDAVRISEARETRVLALNTNFQPEADEKAMRLNATVEFSSAQYAAIGSGKKLTVIMELKNGSAVVGRESNVTASGAITNYSGWGNNTVTTNSNTGSLTMTAYSEANLLPATNYQVAIKVFVDGVLKTITTDYTVTSVTGTFSKMAKSITAAGTESTLYFRGETCISAAGYSSLTSGDILEFSVSDASSNTYSYSGEIRTSNGNMTQFNFNNTTSKYEASVTSQMLTDKVYVTFWADVYSPVAATYAPEVTIKKAGTATNIAEACVTAPSTAPTLTATATGLSMTVDGAGGTGVECYIADARHPLIWLVRSSTYGSQTSCSFFGLKRGDYVGWYERKARISQTNYDDRLSDRSPLSTSVAYAGGNGSYRTFTGTSGGSGQGSLTLTNIDYAGSDFQTERRASDGNGGLLIGTIHGADDEVNLRQLTPTGMSTTFGGSGVVSVSLPPVNIRAGTPTLGWYGTGRDKWMMMTTLPGAQTYDGYGMASGITIFSTGDYSGGNQSSTLISTTEIGRFCQANVSGQDNVSQYSYIQNLVSAPTADPLLLVSCEIRHGNTGSYYSVVPFLVTLSNGVLTLKASLGDEPTSAEKCSSTIISAVNSGATGSEVMLASFQRTWNPSNTECWLYNNAVSATSVVSRDVFTVTSAYARTAVRDVLTVTGTNEPVLGSSGGMGMTPTMRLIVSGPNTHLLTSDVSGSSPNQVVKYRIARLSNNSFGTFEQQPFMNVASTDSFNSGTNFSQIADYSENQAGSVLLSRSDFSAGSTAARVDLATGEMTTYQQMASSSVGMADGGSVILGNSSGALNFFGITSRTTAVLGQWTTTGAFDPALSALPINQGASNTGVSQGNPGPNPGPAPVVAPGAAYSGPIVKAPGLSKTVTRGNKLKLEGSSLSGVTKVTVAGKDASVKVNSAGEIEIIVPSDLPNGTYDLIVTSASGVLTVQDAIKVANFASVSASTKLIEDAVKVYYFAAVGAGKVQFMLNGKEVAWVSAATDSDPKLRDGYLVRTIDLQPGKNVIEIFVDGVRVKRVAHTK